MQAEVQQRLGQNARVVEVERYQQPTQATVAVQKGVDGLELQMRQTRPDEHRQSRGTVIMKETLQLAHAFGHRMGRRRDKVGQTRPWAANPVLRSAELARQLVVAPAPSQEDFVDFAQQTVGKGEA